MDPTVLIAPVPDSVFHSGPQTPCRVMQHLFRFNLSAIPSSRFCTFIKSTGHADADDLQDCAKKTSSVPATFQEEARVRAKISWRPRVIDQAPISSSTGFMSYAQTHQARPRILRSIHDGFLWSWRRRAQLSLMFFKNKEWVLAYSESEWGTIRPTSSLINSSIWLSTKLGSHPDPSPGVCQKSCRFISSKLAKGGIRAKVPKGCLSIHNGSSKLKKDGGLRPLSIFRGTRQ